MTRTQTSYTETCKKTLLNAEDIMKILGCGKTQAYSIIKNLNNERIKNNHPVFRGKVFAEHLYQSYGLSRELEIHNSLS